MIEAVAIGVFGILGVFIALVVWSCCVISGRCAEIEEHLVPGTGPDEIERR